MRIIGSADVFEILHLVVDEPPDGDTGAGDANYGGREEGEDQKTKPGKVQSHFVAAVDADQMQRLIDEGR